jgi:hypothetical protein
LSRDDEIKNLVRELEALVLEQDAIIKKIRERLARLDQLETEMQHIDYERSRI